jgi:hypothetical protein
MPYFDFDSRNIDDQSGWGAPLGVSAHGSNRRESGSAAWRKSFTISIAINAFIPRNKGQIVHGMAAVDPDLRNVAWGFEPHQYRLGKRFYMFATDDRSYAGESGSSRVSLGGQFDSMRIGSLGTLGTLFNVPPSESAQLQADVTSSLLGPSYVPGTLLREKSYPTKRERVQDYSAVHSGITLGASGAYPFNSRTPSIDFGLSASLQVLADGNVALAAVGGHNTFPAYEVILNGRVVYKSYPMASGPGLWNLTAFSENFRFRAVIRADGGVSNR